MDQAPRSSDGRQALRLLLLGGTGEAAALARALASGGAGDARIAAMLSLAGRTERPATPPIPHRVGGFGGAAGLAAWLRAERVEAIVDATHPFAARISVNAIEASIATGVPLLRIDRPPWQPGPADRWRMAPSMADAAAALGTAPRRVMLTVGRQDLGPFRAMPHRYLIRSVEPPPAAELPPHAEVLTARGPFAAEDELRLLTAHAIEILVTKDSGGDATRGKLDAARALGLTVVMVARPPQPPGGERVETVAAALDWLARRHAERGV